MVYDEATFVSQYTQIIQCVKTRLIFLAERCEQPVGFVLAYPDQSVSQGKQTSDTLIVKVVAVLPQYKATRLARLLVSYCGRLASEMGFTKVIFAHLPENSVIAQQIGIDRATAIRSYQVLGMML
jgi:hypothetical protein